LAGCEFRSGGDYILGLATAGNTLNSWIYPHVTTAAEKYDCIMLSHDLFACHSGWLF
jgi:hypothetical protein